MEFKCRGDSCVNQMERSQFPLMKTIVIQHFYSIALDGTFSFFLYIYNIQFTQKNKIYNHQVLKMGLPGNKIN